MRKDRLKWWEVADNDLGEPKVKKLGEEMSKYVKYQSF